MVPIVEGHILIWTTRCPPILHVYLCWKRPWQHHVRRHVSSPADGPDSKVLQRSQNTFRDASKFFRRLSGDFPSEQISDLNQWFQLSGAENSFHAPVYIHSHCCWNKAPINYIWDFIFSLIQILIIGSGSSYIFLLDLRTREIKSTFIVFQDIYLFILLPKNSPKIHQPGLGDIWITIWCSFYVSFDHF